MNYFTSGIYGDLPRYKKIKEILKPSDHLWILGDVMDGNTNRPWECLTILEDIYQSDNITLILGDHEYFHATYLIDSGALTGEPNPDEESIEEDIKNIDEMEISGAPLREHMENSLSFEEKASYAQMILKCDASDMVRIGDHVLYICHGAPSVLTKSPDALCAWQERVVTETIDLYEDYSQGILSDPDFPKFREKVGDIIAVPIIVTGGTIVADLESDGEKTIDGIIFKNKKFVLNEGITADDESKGPFSLLALDAAGFFIKKITI